VAADSDGAADGHHGAAPTKGVRRP
jgi:hypothetical protein